MRLSILICLLVFHLAEGFQRTLNRLPASRKLMSSTASSTDKLSASTSSSEGFEGFRPSTVDKARTITHVCTSGTLCTTSRGEHAPGTEGSPFGSYVDYILDDKGWPVLLLSDQSMHTANIKEFSQGFAVLTAATKFFYRCCGCVVESHGDG